MEAIEFTNNKVIEYNDILQMMDGKRVVLLKNRGNKILRCKANIEDTTVELYDTQDKYYGCFIKDQLPHIANNVYANSFEILPF